MQPELIMETLRVRFGLAAQLVRPIGGGADPHARVFRADGGRGPVVVKVQSVAAAERAVTVAAVLSELHRLELPSPVPTRGGDAYAVLHGEVDTDPAALVVWPFRAGRSGFEQYQSPRVLARVGDLIRAVHDLAVTPRVAEQVPRDELGDQWRAETLRLVADPPVASDQLGERLVQLLDRLGDRLAALATSARDLAARLEREPAPETVLCHGDLHAGNVLVGPDGSITVIDWDTAVLARRERDLMFAGAGIAGTWSSPEEVGAFRSGYCADSDCPIDETAIAYYRCDRVCEDVVLYARSIGDPETSDRMQDIATLEGQFQPGDVVAAAERSLAAVGLG